MKKIVLLLAAVFVFCHSFVLADAVDPTSALRESESTSKYKVLEKGSKGTAVKELQLRLIEKGYLDGKADGSFGNITRSAVMLFEYQNGFDVTGIASSELQSLLFSESCPDSIEWAELDFASASSDPEGCLDRFIRFEGRILQVIVGDDNVVLRLASRGAYEDVVYITAPLDEYTAALKVGKRIRGYGIHKGLFTYQNKASNDVTLPHIDAGFIVSK